MIHTDQLTYRALHTALLNYSGNNLFAEVLEPWAKAETQEGEWLQSFKERDGSPFPQVEQQELWRLYAVSRIFELLLLRFQSGLADGSNWEGPPISLSEYQAFAHTLGFNMAQSTSFSPFYHEVIEIEPASDQAQPPQVVEYQWPCLMLGNMVFMRAGVRVSAGRNIMKPGVADLSTLYWAYRRKNRPYADLSHGWGSNSQWRTNFRRDYLVGNTYYYNVDGQHNLNAFGPEEVIEDGLLPALRVRERIELLMNRCFVLTDKTHTDLWPYADTFRILE